MKNLPLLLGTLLGTIAIVVALALLFSRPEPVVTADAGILMKENRASKGPEHAKVTIVEFSDFQCPSCKAFDPVIKGILAKHPNDVRVIFRHFPLTTIHSNAQAAAQAAEAAKTFGKFWEMHDMLFQEQNIWADLDSAGFQKKLEEYAEKLTIDKSEFQKKMNSNEVKEVVTVDVSDGTRANVNGTPTFFVNGQLVPAPQQLSTVVDSALAK